MNATFTQDDLAKEIAQLTKAMRRANSLWRAFLSGLMRGIGAIVAAVIIMGIVSFFLWRAARSFNFEDMLKSVMPTAEGPQAGIMKMVEQFMFSGGALPEGIEAGLKTPPNLPFLPTGDPSQGDKRGGN